MTTISDKKLIEMMMRELPEALEVTYPQLEECDIAEPVMDQLLDPGMSDGERDVLAARIASIASALVKSKIIDGALHTLAADMKDSFIKQMANEQ